MKKSFGRETVLKAPRKITPRQINLLAPLKIPVPEGKPWWLVVVAIGVIGLVGGIVVVSFASGARTFNGVGALFPVLMIGGIIAMLFGSRFGGGNQMSRGKMDALRAQFMVKLDDLRRDMHRAADDLDENFRWYHPPTSTLEAALGGRRMWERSPAGHDTWFGVIRVGVGMTSLKQAQAVSFNEPTDMPTDIEMEPATGVALQEFVRAQQVTYGTPALISLLVEPGWRLDGDRERVLAVMRAIVCQMVFSHGPDHLQLITITDDIEEWDWLKWLPHVADNRVQDAAGGLRMVYPSVRDFYEAQYGAVLQGRDRFNPRHGAAKDQIQPLPHTVIISDVSDGSTWSSLINAEGVAGVTVFDLRGVVPTSANPQRLLRVSPTGDIDAVPRDLNTFAPELDNEPTFFARADQMDREDAENFALGMARERLSQAYEMIDVAEDSGSGPARDILSYYDIDDPANINFNALWGPRGDILSDDRMKAPYGTRADTGELLVLDIKETGAGPHGLMVGTTGSGKTEGLKTFLLSLLCGHPPENLQLVLADFKGGAGVKPFTGTPHVSCVMTDLEDDQTQLGRFVDAIFGEIARRKAIVDSVGAGDAEDYNRRRADAARDPNGPQLEPMPRLFVVVDEFTEGFKMDPTLVVLFDLIARQGRSLWIHLLLASQEVDSRADKLTTNIGYRIALRTNSPASAAASGVPASANLPNKKGLGYLRVGLTEDLTKLQFEYLWRDYRKPGAAKDDDNDADLSTGSLEYFEPQLFTVEPIIIDEPNDSGDEVPADPAETDSQPSPVADDGAIRKPKVGEVIIDQLRAIPFEPHRLVGPPLDKPNTIDDVVEMYLGRPWDDHYAAQPDLTFPIGVIDRPFKQDQQPLLADGTGNLMVLGGQGSGKTTTLVDLICAAAMTHTPEQVQFYVLALSGTSLVSVRDFPHVGRVATILEEDAIRRTVAELLELLTLRRRGFLEWGITSMEGFRNRKAALRRQAGEQASNDPVAQDRFGDVYLVVDNFAALSDPASTFRGREVLVDEINKLIREGGSFGIHVVVAVSKPQELSPQMRDLFNEVRIELKADETNVRLVKSSEAKKVPSNRPGRGMVKQNYLREGWDEVGLHTMMARPALRGTGERVFEAQSVVARVSQLAEGYRPAPRVRQLPNRVELAQLRQSAAAHNHVGAVWAVNEHSLPVGLGNARSPFLVVTGSRKCGRTTTCAAIMSEIGRVYAPGSSKAVRAADDARPAAQVWLVTPGRELMRVLDDRYVEAYAYRKDTTKQLAERLSQVLADRLPQADLGMADTCEKSWTGPEIFLVIDNAERLPAGYDHVFAPLVEAANAAEDVGLHVIYSRQFGGWMNVSGRDPLLATMLQANADLLVMDSDSDEGFVRGRWRGHPMPQGRGFLMGTGGSGSYVQVGWVPVGVENG
ncbi:type VII secretion protein EccC [Mycolicibacterium conceptionense]|uniref:type VII secretion protein EccCa n=1 Tax=Mycolicibacterium conceptionense TaxID=451644 RepID=UPI0007E964E3|nr:type VII secretion protein EccCa [Mycolicibacterium conceptionense]OBB05347.1 type VII secretion protein EccC [Mycolicibacterium conceptionense]OBF03383.1 type VII secretion protein EccC [Mycolicibacterium conceptionense]